MKIKKIIKDLDIEIVKGSKDIEITGIAIDSKVVAPGNLFIALKGDKFDGNEFIQNAILAGAVAILSDIFNPFLEGVTQCISKDVRGALPQLAKNFYEDPSSKLFMVGITGTSGKTTTSYLVKHLLDKLAPTGLIGTIERIVGDYRTPSDLTTPDLVTTNKLLHDMVHANLKHAVMEVSSHALDLGRVSGVLYDSVLFTNLSEEHLDYHKDLDDYARAKAKLFSPLHLKKGGIAFINEDSEYGKAMKRVCQERIITFGINQVADYKASDINYGLDKTSFTLRYQDESIKMTIPLIGDYNVYNALGAIAIAHRAGLSLVDIKKRLVSFPPVKGRLAPVPNRMGRNIFVDYAHKPEALRSVLETVRRIKKGRLIVLFGCGGDRDPYKRPKMARIAEELSDFVIVTSDNPRSEPPEKIIEEIVSGFQEKRFLVCQDRKEAIQKGISLLEKDDILLLAGRGHEERQIYKFQSIPFDDLKVAEEIVNALT